MVQKDEITIDPKYCFSPSAKLLGDFRFIVMQRFLSYQNEISMSNTLIINIYFLLKNFSLSEEKEYAIDDSDVVLEKYPLIISPIGGSGADKNTITCLCRFILTDSFCSPFRFC